MAAPTDVLIASAGGDFLLTMFAILFMFVIGLCGWLVYRMPKEWEASTDRIVAKLCSIMDQQIELKNCLKEHDTQAKVILRMTEKMETNLESRPCANGKK